MKFAQRGFSLMELLVAIGILSILMTLLAFPLFTAFGYVQKATARADALRAGNQVAHKIAADLGQAMYIFELPPDGGSWVSFLLELDDQKSGATDDEKLARSIGLPVDGADEARFVRYAQLPAYPWDASGNLAWPDYLMYLQPFTNTQSFYTRENPFPPKNPKIARPFYERSALPGNPMILGRYEDRLPWAQVWDQAELSALDGTFPHKTFTGSREVRTRQMDNAYISLSPRGSAWDISRFRVAPERIREEALKPRVDGQGHSDPTVVFSRYPLWAGRTRDIDDLIANRASADIAGLLTLFQKATYGDLNADLSMLNRIFQYTGATHPQDTNPFGYQVKVFSQDGDLVYGTRYNDVAKTYSAYAQCHYMEWPRIDRPSKLRSGELVESESDPVTPPFNDLATWTAEEIMGHRMQGKVVFAQPVATDHLRVVTAGGASAAYLPIPNSATWLWNSTYLITPPERFTMTLGAETKTFERITRAEMLNLPIPQRTGKFYIDYEGDFTAGSRLIRFGETLTDGDWAIQGANGLSYTICDLHPSDTVVATYATKAVLNVAVTVSHQDSAARNPVQQRQDVTVNVRVEAKNAIRRARGLEGAR